MKYSRDTDCDWEFQRGSWCSTLLVGWPLFGVHAIGPPELDEVVELQISQVELRHLAAARRAGGLRLHPGLDELRPAPRDDVAQLGRSRRAFAQAGCSSQYSCASPRCVAALDGRCDLGRLGSHSGCGSLCAGSAPQTRARRTACRREDVARRLGCEACLMGPPMEAVDGCEGEGPHSVASLKGSRNAGGGDLQAGLNTV